MQKDSLVLKLSCLLVVATIAIYVLHNVVMVSHTVHQLHLNPIGVLLAAIVPALLFAVTWLHYKGGSSQRIQQWLNMLVITFCSIGMITAGHGMVEYHFSIFMVLAIVSYYEKINIIVIMTGLFLVQHILGFFLFTPYVFGAAVGEYTFVMLLYHALFLLGTSGVLIWQITHKGRLRKELSDTIQQQHQLTELLSKMKLSSERLAQAADQLQALYRNALGELDGIVQTVNSISADTNHHSQFTSESSELVEHIVEGLGQISLASKKVVDRAGQMSNKVDDGEALMNIMLEHMKALELQCKRYAGVVSRLHALTMDVETMAKFIINISKQTKLLSLNANIEAAVAGAKGKGFAVVATEIGKLAQESNEAAKQITTFVASIDEEAKNSVVSMEALLQQVGQAVVFNKEMVTLLHEIHEIVSHTATQYELVSGSTESIVVSAQEANASVNEMSKLANAINKKTLYAAGAANELQKRNEQLSPFIGQLIDISTKLKGSE